MVNVKIANKTGLTIKLSKAAVMIKFCIAEVRRRL